jgi:hypothetical protein
VIPLGVLGIRALRSFGNSANGTIVQDP